MNSMWRNGKLIVEARVWFSFSMLSIFHICNISVRCVCVCLIFGIWRTILTRPRSLTCVVCLCLSVMLAFICHIYTIATTTNNNKQSTHSQTLVEQYVFCIYNSFHLQPGRWNHSISSLLVVIVSGPMRSCSSAPYGRAIFQTRRQTWLNKPVVRSAQCARDNLWFPMSSNRTEINGFVAFTHGVILTKLITIPV